MVQRGHCLGFAMETLEVGRILNPRLGQDLDRDASPHQRVFRQVDRAHPTTAEQRNQLVLAEEETLVLALQQLVDLPLAQQIAADKLAGNLFGVLRILARIFEALPELLQLTIFDQPALAHG